jgi:hypothetical protein
MKYSSVKNKEVRLKKNDTAFCREVLSTKSITSTLSTAPHVLHQIFREQGIRKLVFAQDQPFVGIGSLLLSCPIIFDF